MSPDTYFDRPGWPADRRLRPARADLAAAHLRDAVNADRYEQGRIFQVRAGWTALRARPEAAADRMTELLYGEAFAVYEMRAGWAWGQSLVDGYVGYAEAGALAERSDAPTHRVISPFSHLYTGPDVKSVTGTALPFASLVTAKGPAGEDFLATTEGYVPARHVAALDDHSTDPVAVACLFRGMPYLWGGRTAAGLDCSALVQLSLAACGLDLPRDTDLQEVCLRSGPGHVAEEISEADSRPGDLIYFPGHVGFLLEGGRILHATGTLMDCRIEPLEHLLDRVRSTHDTPVTGIFRPHLPRPATEGASAGSDRPDS